MENVLVTYRNQAQNWQNELDFYQTEVCVLHQLLDKHLHSLHHETQVKQLGELLNELFEWSKAGKHIVHSITAQLKYLTDIIRNDDANLGNSCLFNQEVLSKKMDSVRCEYQQLKQDIYTLTSSLLNEKKFSGSSCQ